mgnify:FL=1|tara:strand:+ start:546 stop:920 length:375 start_codon:yes stop_codon:yes gene_type:complete
MAKQSKAFDYNKYTVEPSVERKKIVIEQTGDEFEVSVKTLSWSRRNQLVSRCLKVANDGQSSFDGDKYIRECLKEIIVEAPWGPTNEAFLVSIDDRLGTALEKIVPSAFGDKGGQTPDEIKKES